jgi:hypothetical protein
VDTTSIAGRFSGPAGTGNGGYVSGVAAEPLGAAAVATLRRPVPLEVPLDVQVDHEARTSALRLDGELLVEAAALDEAGRNEVLADLRGPVDAPAAEQATLAYPWADEHAFPTCFTCGTGREPGDGLCIFPGPVGDGRFAAPWVPDDSLDRGDGCIDHRFVWAALDCPTAIPAVVEIDSAPSVLGRLSLVRLAEVRVGAPHVVVSWSLGHEGRKRFGAAALYRLPVGSGSVAGPPVLVAASRATWIELNPA